MINWSGQQTRSPALGFSALGETVGAPLFCDCRKTMADLQTGYQHATITSCHLYIFQPGTVIPPPTTAHDVMAHDIISFRTANLPFPFFFFFATLRTFIKSDRITSGKGCTGTGLGHTQWVGKWQTGRLLGGGKSSPLSI